MPIFDIFFGLDFYYQYEFIVVKLQQQQKNELPPMKYFLSKNLTIVKFLRDLRGMNVTIGISYEILIKTLISLKFVHNWHEKFKKNLRLSYLRPYIYNLIMKGFMGSLGLGLGLGLEFGFRIKVKIWVWLSI